MIITARCDFHYFKLPEVCIMGMDSLFLRYNINPDILISFCPIYAYAPEASEPVLFSHYRHEHHAPGPVTYQKSNDWCTLFIFLSGKFGFIFDDSICNPAFGNAVLVREKEIYSSYFYSDSMVDYYQIDFPTEFFRQLGKENPFFSLFHPHSTMQKNLVALSRSSCDRMIGMLKQMDTLIQENDPQAGWLAYSYLIQIAVIIQNAHASGDHSPVQSKVPAKLKEAIDYIHKNCCSLIGVSEVAQHCGITNTYLSRLFKNAMDCSPNEYITNLRISNAKYLIHSGRSLTDACYLSGFSNYTYFTSKFKSYTGMTPSQYQKL